jgi:hypothetical protein
VVSARRCAAGLHAAARFGGAAAGNYSSVGRKEPGKDNSTMADSTPLIALTASLPPEWKWIALFNVPEGYEREWRGWLAEAVHAEDLSLLRFWAKRADKAA